MHVLLLISITSLINFVWQTRVEKVKVNNKGKSAPSAPWRDPEEAQLPGRYVWALCPQFLTFWIILQCSFWGKRKRNKIWWAGGKNSYSFLQKCPRHQSHRLHFLHIVSLSAPFLPGGQIDGCSAQSCPIWHFIPAAGEQFSAFICTVYSLRLLIIAHHFHLNKQDSLN